MDFWKIAIDLSFSNSITVISIVGLKESCNPAYCIPITYHFSSSGHLKRYNDINYKNSKKLYLRKIFKYYEYR